MTIRERLSEIAAQERVVKKNIPGLGEVHFRRLSAGEVIGLQGPGQSSGEYQIALLVNSAMDDEGNPLFASADAVRALPWAAVQPLFFAQSDVNTALDLDAATKK